jgi:NAD-dependent dihydropyrimidine dehydrogenase PreA subunit
MKCLAVCPVAVFVEWEPEPGKAKADPAKESDCLECLICEIICPVEAILITRSPSTHDTLKALLE